MKKLSIYTPLIREAEEKALSDLQKDWREYFGAKLSKYGAKSPAELDDAKKKDFFNDLKNDWEKGQGAKESGKKDIKEYGVKENFNTLLTLNEARSIEKVHDEWGKVTREMAEIVKVWKAAEGDAKTKALNTLKALTARKKELEKELNKLIAAKDKDIELVIDEKVIYESFEVHYSDGVRAFKKFNSEKQAIAFAKDLIKNKKGLQFVDVFNAGSGFHSSADTDAIVAFWGDGSYTDNVAKKDSKLAAKKINESAINEADIKSDSDFKEYAETVLKKAFGKKYDADKAKETIDGILSKSKGDYGAAVGMLTSGLG